MSSTNRTVYEIKKKIRKSTTGVTQKVAAVCDVVSAVPAHHVDDIDEQKQQKTAAFTTIAKEIGRAHV